MDALEDRDDMPHTPAADDSEESGDDYDPFQDFISATRSSLSDLESASSEDSEETSNAQPISHTQSKTTFTSDIFASLDDFPTSIASSESDSLFDTSSDDEPIDILRALQLDAVTMRVSQSHETLTLIICEGKEDDDPLDLVDLVFRSPGRRTPPTPFRNSHKYTPSDPFVLRLSGDGVACDDAGMTAKAYIRPLPPIPLEDDEDEEEFFPPSSTFEHLLSHRY